MDFYKLIACIKIIQQENNFSYCYANQKILYCYYIYRLLQDVIFILRLCGTKIISI